MQISPSMSFMWCPQIKRITKLSSTISYTFMALQSSTKEKKHNKIRTKNYWKLKHIKFCVSATSVRRSFNIKVKRVVNQQNYKISKFL